MTTTYASTPLDYDFASELAAALAPQERPTASLTAEQRHWRTQFPDAPTSEALRKQAERFGPEGVQEIAAAYGLDLKDSTPARQPRRLSGTRSKRASARALDMVGARE